MSVGQKATPSRYPDVVTATFDWPIDRSSLPALPEIGSPPTDAYKQALTERNAAENMAVAILYALSGRQFGLITRTVRPCPTPGWSRYRDGWWSSWDLLIWDGANYQTLSCGCHRGRCNISGPRVVHLPGPVYDITEVKIAGVVLDTTGYQVEGNALYRRAATGVVNHEVPRWPDQDLGRPLGEMRTWGVTYRVGIPAPDYVAELTGLLAKEILAALNEEGRCRLPRTVTTVSRNGVSYRAYDPAVIYANGKTGIPEIDLWLAAVNPHALAASPSVL